MSAAVSSGRSAIGSDAAAVLEPVGHDLEPVELRERLAGSTLALGPGCSLLLGAGYAPVDHASLRTQCR